jgi:hypothetical protein
VTAQFSPEAITDVTNAVHMSRSLENRSSSSKPNKTPPRGLPKATDTPAAAAADRTRRFLTKTVFSVFLRSFAYTRVNLRSLVPNDGNSLITSADKQQLTCTIGPWMKRASCIGMRIAVAIRTSFPRERPDATESARPSPLINSVQGPRNASRT